VAFQAALTFIVLNERVAFVVMSVMLLLLLLVSSSLTTVFANYAQLPCRMEVSHLLRRETAHRSTVG
jgi:hypothetical protein